AVAVAEHRRDSGGARDHARERARGARSQLGLLHGLAVRRARRRGGARSPRDDRGGGRGLPALRGPGGPGARPPATPAARARDPADAVRGGAPADPDRAASGALPDARLALDSQVACGDARATELSRALPAALATAAAALALSGCI